LDISGQNGKLPLEVQVIGCEEQPCVIYREGDVSALVDFNVCKINCFFVPCTYVHFSTSFTREVYLELHVPMITVKRKLVHKCMRGGQGLGSQGTLNPQ